MGRDGWTSHASYDQVLSIYSQIQAEAASYSNDICSAGKGRLSMAGNFDFRRQGLFHIIKRSWKVKLGCCTNASKYFASVKTLKEASDSCFKCEFLRPKTLYLAPTDTRQLNRLDCLLKCFHIS
ncbi:hypothetical protein BDW60DRAFT_187358 [Aspergillus nidulans var. acristatus]